ncbi:hypothetical protein BASA83_012034 [Batrachochytrium salamandrivorans]|nr:hypothetical protein BASA83_012034 [Batrachochytrium salamandrivorans]
MGIIKIDSFYLEDVGTMSLAVLKAVMTIRSLLANELKDTKSVMYDLRGNPGGNADFANNMVQLFKPDFEPFGHRYLMNPITQNIFVDGEDYNVDPYAKAWQETSAWKKTKKGNHFTNVFSLNSMESANALGQAYFRPMGVLNDGRCYSACEVFSGSIQGHDAGTIFGEDKQTGGGGATVVKLDPWLIDASSAYFQKFPFSQQLTSGSIAYANTLTVGITQLIRTGRYNGQTIEDAVRLHYQHQYARIASSLARTGQKNGQSKLHFVCEPFSIEKHINGFLLEVETAGIDEFTVFQADGKTLIAQQKKKWSFTNKQKLTIPVSTVASTLGNNRIIIIGKTAGVQVLKTIRNVRTIPNDDNTAPADGWNNLRGPWMIGNGVQYVGGIDSSIEAFFSSPVGTKINIGIDVTLDSEPGCDFLYLSVKSRGGVEDFLPSL